MIFKKADDKNKKSARPLFCRAQSAVEYIALIMIVVTALFIFQKFIARGVTGRWKSTGDSFSHGKYYDPDKTVSCEYYEGSKLTGEPAAIWYNEKCFNAHCREACFGVANRKAECLQCMEFCQDDVCSDRVSPDP